MNFAKRLRVVPSFYNSMEKFKKKNARRQQKCTQSSIFSFELDLPAFGTAFIRLPQNTAYRRPPPA
jgi:hypothetical protein